MPDKIIHWNTEDIVPHLRAALAFYADEANWDSIPLEAVDGAELGAPIYQSGPALDRGYRARDALNFEAAS